MAKCGMAIIPVNRMTYRCKNITLPQTSFVGGNYICTCESGNYTHVKISLNFQIHMHTRGNSSVTAG